MSFIRKMLCSFLIFAGFISNQVQAFDTRDEQGRTPLMNFVIEKEAQILKDAKDLEDLWNMYFYKEKRQDGYAYVNGMVVPLYKYIPIRKIYTTDEDVAVYRQKEQDFINFMSATIKNINVIVQSGVDVNAKDFAGNTVQNYCYSESIYNELRRLGADFQYCPWIYFNPVLGTFATTGAVLGALIVIGSARIINARTYDSQR